MTQKDLYKVEDYRIQAECGQAFEPVMPKVIEKIGEIGAEGTDMSVFEQGHGVSPMGTADIAGL